MKHLLTILMIMTMASVQAQDGKATTIKKTFSRQTAVSIKINADASIIWSLITNASDFARWNSTIVSLDGEIKKGEKIRLVSTLDESRTFKIKVKEMLDQHSMTWGDGKGNRVYTLTQNSDNTVTFSMVEKIGGLMFPMYAKYIPDFDENFETWVADLKKEAERINTVK